MAAPFFGRIIDLPRRAKQALLTVNDALLAPVALLVAAALQSNAVSASGFHWGLGGILALMATSAVLTLALGIHRIQLKAYESRAVLMSVLHAILVAGLAAALDRAMGYGTKGATFVTFAFLYPGLVSGSRLVGLRVLLDFYRRGQAEVRVIIYGAGRTGQQLAAALRTDDVITPVGFVDDNRALQGTIIQGLTVHPPSRLDALIRDKRVRRVLLAMPSVPRPRQAQVVRRLQGLGIQVQTLPSFADLVGTGGTLVQQLRRVDADAFLGRTPLTKDLPTGSATYVGRTILISGAGGSIGSELCRQLLGCKPRRLVLLDSSELALFKIDLELAPLCAEARIELVTVLGSVADAPLVRRVLAEQGVEVVLHAAAYKHVHLVEQNPVAGVTNNVIGTQVLAAASLEAGVGRFILISSDKAVRPHNLMGASKRLSELVVQDLASRADARPAGTIFTMVRFGNVLGSSGSVIPLFQDQINRGGPVTLTDREVTRYFMTIPEAARLVLVAGSYATGGDLFVLDMGDPVPIYGLARRMIEASGLSVRDAENPDGDIDIVLTGLRPGEKLHEELLIGSDCEPTAHPKIMSAREARLSEIEMASCLRGIRAAAESSDPAAMRAVVARWVEGGSRLLARLPHPAE